MISIKELQSKKTGIVLSGGGIKGMAHIGVLQALKEYNIQPTIISGVSAGALVGALYANNVSTNNMLHFFKDTPLFKYNLVSINKPGFFDTEKYIPYLEKYIKATTFESLAKSLYVVATSMEAGESIFFSKGDLLQPLLASAALPPVFSPVTFNKNSYSDGAIMNNFPIEPLLNNCDLIIGSYTSSKIQVTKKQLNNSLQISQRANLLMLHANVIPKLTLTDILFQPEGLDEIGILDKKGIDKAYNMGYEHVNKILSNLIK